MEAIIILDVGMVVMVSGLVGMVAGLWLKVVPFLIIMEVVVPRLEERSLWVELPGLIADMVNLLVGLVMVEMEELAQEEVVEGVGMVVVEEQMPVEEGQVTAAAK